MVLVKIDGIEVEVPDDSTILEAAQMAGIFIPNLCYDRRLKPYGACRLCIVETEGSPRLFTACSTPVTPNMAVVTNSERVKKARRTLMELLLVHHPLDCPVCDSAGECELQNLTMELNQITSRFKAERSQKPVDRRSPLIEKNSNRCILCGKCVRICEEFVGAHAIDFAFRGFEAEVGPAFGGKFDCEFCGQCISVCPVGALNNALFRYKARPWELSTTPSVCGYCGTGCSILIQAKGGRVVRILGRRQGVNDEALCGKGRFGFQFVNSEARLKSPLIRKNGKLEESTWDEALTLVVNKLSELSRCEGVQVAAIGSPRLTNEESYLFQKLMRAGFRTNNIDSFAGSGFVRAVDVINELYPENKTLPNMAEVQEASTVFILDSNIAETNPVFTFQVLKGARNKNVKMIVANSRKSKLDRYASLSLDLIPGTGSHLVVGILKILYSENKLKVVEKTPAFEWLNRVTGNFSLKEISEITGITEDEMKSACSLIVNDKSFFIISSGISENTKNTETIQLFANLAILTGNRENFLLTSEFNNIQGACDMGVRPDKFPGYTELKADGKEFKAFEKTWGVEPLPAQAGFTINEIIDNIQKGVVKGLFVAGEDPVSTFPGVKDIKSIFQKLEFLVVEDIFLSETAKVAHVVLPGAAWAEKDGTFTNFERRVQRIRKSSNIQGKAKSDWEILKELCVRVGLKVDYKNPGDIMNEIASLVPGYGMIHYSGLETEGRKARIPGNIRDFFNIEIERPEKLKVKEFPFYLITGSLLLHSGTLSVKCLELSEVNPGGFVEIAEDDARQMNLSEGDRVKVCSNSSFIEARVKITDALKQGTVFLPVHFPDFPVRKLLLDSNHGKISIPLVNLVKII